MRQPELQNLDVETSVYGSTDQLLPPTSIYEYRLNADDARKIIVYKFMRFYTYCPKYNNRPLLKELLGHLKLDESFMQRLQFFLRNEYDRFSNLKLIQRGEYDPATKSWLEDQWDGKILLTQPALPPITRSLRNIGR